MGALALFEREDFRLAAGDAWRPGGVGLTAQMLDRLGLGPGARVADVGCGPGATLALLHARGLAPVGVDPSAQLLGRARRLAPAALVLSGVAERLPLADGVFAAVLCECVLSVTPDPAAALVQMRRVLAPGGRLALADIYLREQAAPYPGRPSACAPGLAPGRTAEPTPARTAEPTPARAAEPTPARAPGHTPACASLAVAGHGGAVSGPRPCDSPPASSLAPGCAAGAVTRPLVLARLARAGYIVDSFEDHSPLLAQLAGALVFAGLPRTSLGLCGPGGGRPGYYVCIAHKEPT